MTIEPRASMSAELSTTFRSSRGPGSARTDGRLRRRLKLAAIVGVAVAVLVVYVRYDLGRLVEPARIDRWLESAGPLAPLLFIGSMAAAIIVSPIPTLPLDIIAGRLFGPILGTLYASIGGLLGAMAGFQIARFLGRELLARYLTGHINFCRQCSDKLLTRIVFLSRLIPFVSFDVVSYGAGLTNMSAMKFGVATFIGMLPLTFLYTSFGSALLANRVVAWTGGLVVVGMFLLLPVWIERANPFGMARHFEHPEPDQH